MISEHAQHVWIVVKLLFVLLDLGVSIARNFGACSAWLRRNLSRFVTLLFGAACFIESDWKKWHAFIFLMGLLTWNLPKDDQGPPKRRRRREQERKEEHLPPNWSGVPENA